MGSSILVGSTAPQAKTIRSDGFRDLSGVDGSRPLTRHLCQQHRSGPQQHMALNACLNGVWQRHCTTGHGTILTPFSQGPDCFSEDSQPQNTKPSIRHCRRQHRVFGQSTIRTAEIRNSRFRQVSGRSNGSASDGFVGCTFGTVLG